MGPPSFFQRRMVETFSTKITCERSLAKSVIGAVLQAILFQRAFGTVVPGTKDVLGPTLPCVVASELDGIVDARVDEIYRAIEHQTASSTNRSRQATAVVSFCQERVTRTWYSKTVEEVPWEEYHVTFEMLSGQTEKERNKIDGVTRRQLSAFLLALVVFADSHKAHTPPITNNDILPFPLKITLQVTT